MEALDWTFAMIHCTTAVALGMDYNYTFCEILVYSVQ